MLRSIDNLLPEYVHFNFIKSNKPKQTFDLKSFYVIQPFTLNSISTIDIVKLFELSTFILNVSRALRCCYKILYQL